MKSNNTKIQSKHNNISLQRFTNNTDSIETLKQLYQSSPKEFKEVFYEILEEVNKCITGENKKVGDTEKYFNLLHKFIEVIVPEELENNRRLQYQVNKMKIEEAIHKSIIDNNRVPLQYEIEQITKLSRTTIAKHIKAGTGAEYYKEDSEVLKLLSHNVLKALYRIGITQNNVKALKVFLDYVGNTTSRYQNNFIQINNTRIDEVIINQLPEEERLKVENIFKRYQYDK
jgi:hypothetical protein